jgi:hypothetical protein
MSPRTLALSRLVVLTGAAIFILVDTCLVGSALFEKTEVMLTHWPSGERTPVWYFDHALITILVLYPALVVQDFVRSRSRWIICALGVLALIGALLSVISASRWALMGFFGLHVAGALFFAFRGLRSVLSRHYEGRPAGA